MNKNTFCRYIIDCLSFNSSIISLNNVSLYISWVVDLVKRPSERSLLSGDFLLHSCKEPLSIKESCHPEWNWSVLADPIVQLEVSIEETLNPASKRWSQPRDFSSSWVKLPLSWHLEIVDTIDGVDKLWGHDNLSINSQYDVNHHSSYDVEDHLEPLDFLEQEDVQWNTFSSFRKSSWTFQRFESLLYFEFYKVFWKLRNKLFL